MKDSISRYIKILKESEEYSRSEPLKLHLADATEPTHAMNLGQMEAADNDLALQIDAVEEDVIVHEQRITDLENLTTGRVEKLIPNTTQYTILATDVDKLLKFTANNGEEIQLIYNENTLPDVNKSIVAMSTGNNILIPTVGTGTVTFGAPAGSLLRTTGVNSLITLQPKSSVNDFSAWGTLEGEAESQFDFETVRPVKTISDNLYTVVAEDKYKYLNFTGTAPVINIPTGVFPDSAILKGITWKALEINNDSPNIDTSVVEGGTLRVKPLGRFDLEIYPSEGGSHLTGDIVHEYEIRQGEDGTLWKVGVIDASGNVIPPTQL